MNIAKTSLVALFLLSAVGAASYWYKSTIPVVIKGSIEVVDIVMLADGGSMTITAREQDGTPIAIEQVNHLGRPLDDRLYLIDYLGKVVPVRHRIDNDPKMKASLSLVLDEYIEHHTTPSQRDALKSNDFARLPRDIDPKVVGVYQLKISDLH